MKKIVSFLLLLVFCIPAFSQVDTLTPEKKARYQINRIRGVKITSIPNYALTNSLSAVVNMAAMRTPTLSMKELRLGKADTAKVVYIQDRFKQGTFVLDTADHVSADDSAMTLVVNAMRYKRPVIGFVNVEWFGASPSNANNFEAFRKALSFGKKVLVPEGTYAVTGVLNVPNGSEIYGTKEKSIIAFGANSYFVPQTNSSIHDLQMSGAIYCIAIMGSDAKNNIRIYNNNFTAGQTGIYIDRGVNVVCYNIHVVDNKFIGLTSAAIRAIVVNDSEFRGNYIRNAAAGRNIEFYGGKRNLVSDNNISSGITGIAFICQFTTAGSVGLVEGNIIRNNTISNISEESISFDVRGNDAANMAVREESYVTSKSTGTGTYFINLNNVNLFNSFKPYTGSYLCFFSGRLKGHAFEILDYTANGSSTQFNLRMNLDQYSLIDVNDVALLGTPFLRNQVDNNNIVMPAVTQLTATGIFLYGFCYYNTVSNNVVRSLSILAGRKQGINVRSLNGLDKTNSKTDPVGGRKAPSENNTLSNNTLINCDQIVDYYGYGTPAPAPFYSYGNRQIGSNVQGQIIVDRNQELVSSSTALLGIVYTNTLPNPNGWEKEVLASGNGTTTISIPHGLGVIPKSFQIAPTNALSAGYSYTTKDITNIVVHYPAVTTTGVDNYSFNLSVSK